MDQVFAITAALSQPGRHAVVYGERGVGKTSLANLLAEFLSMDGAAGPLTVRVNCTTQDDFRSLWVKVFRELEIDAPPEWAHSTPDPDSVRWILGRFNRVSVVVLDEFDRIEDDDALSLVADTIKSLSDHLVETKIVVVGVADSLDQLIGEHESVQRALEEVPMPRMSADEILSVINDGLTAANLSIDPTASKRICRLAEGLPHYAHLLTLHAAQRAVLGDRQRVQPSDVDVATEEAVKKHTLLREYQTAIQSPRKDNLFSRVLAACALAEKNPLGYFTAGAVREPMRKLMGRTYEIAAFATHLNAFTEVDRGCVLRKEGLRRKFIYRFRNPLLQPFAILKLLAENGIPEDYVQELFE